MIERLKREFKLRRVFILDFDAHHGNGTQDIYFEDPSVLLMSVHQDGRTLYPGTGFIHELGSGKGEGYTINVPLPPGSSDAEYATLMEDIFFPVSEAFRPELIAVSAGFDAHAEDPLTGLELSTAAYGWLVRYAVKQAEKLCDGRVVLTLEGGYALDAIAGAAVKIVEVLTGKRPAFPPKRQKVGVVDELKQRLSRYWPL
jgi:acetoin utilization deacetylase AcuC-like enzyme